VAAGRRAAGPGSAPRWRHRAPAGARHEAPAARHEALPRHGAAASSRHGLVRRRAVLLRRRIVTSATVTAVGLGIVIAPALAGRLWEPDALAPIAEVPSDNPELGLVYLGLQPAKKGAPCVGAYQLTDPRMCSHGPDPAPPGLDVKRDVGPVGRTLPSPTLPRRDISPPPRQRDVLADAGASAPAEGTPALAAAAAGPESDDGLGAAGVACAGDGTAGNRVQVMYVHEAGTPSRFSRYLASFQEWAAGVDEIVDASAGRTGGSRHVRYVTTAECAVDVREVQLHTNALATFNATIAALKALGFARTDRKYMIFADANVYCGIGTYVRDDSPGARNRNDRGPAYGRSDAGCWSAQVPAHELIHNLGGVQHTAPHASRAGHCVDDHDLMCYEDTDDTAVDVVCGARAGELRLDCGGDDYFNTTPESGSYLDRHWNVADSSFLLDGEKAGDGPDIRAATDRAPARPGPRSADQPAAGGPGRDAGGRPANGAPGRPEEPAAPPAAPPAEPPPPGPSATPQPEPSATPEPTPPATEPTPTARPPAADEPAPPQGGRGRLTAAGTTATATRLGWPSAGREVRYAVEVDGTVLGTTTATRVRVIGLRPRTAYAMRVSVVGADGARAHTAALTVRTAAAARPAAGRWLELGNALTGGVVRLYGSRGADGTPLVLGRGDGAADQQWQLRAAGAGRFMVRSRATGKCVAPLGAAAAGAVVVQQVCAADDPTLRWRIVRNAHGYALATADGKLVVGVSRLRYAGQRLLVLQRPAGARYQSWSALPAPG
jgi:hypothetical protein